MSNSSLTPEEVYFQQREAELRARLRDEMERKAETSRQKRELGELLGTDDQALIDRLHALGISGEAATVIHLLPLVHVAWADGKLSDGERKAIMRAASAHGVEPGSAAANYIASLLEERPSETLMTEVGALMADLLRAKGHSPDTLLDLCEDVARASGGLLGFGDKISEDERNAIRQIAESLSPEAREAIEQRIREKLSDDES